MREFLPRPSLTELVTRDEKERSEASQARVRLKKELHAALARLDGEVEGLVRALVERRGLRGCLLEWNGSCISSAQTRNVPIAVKARLIRATAHYREIPDLFDPTH